jgi:hypothetical protein
MGSTAPRLIKAVGEEVVVMAGMVGEWWLLSSSWME